jgi:hypothetical protein
MPQVAGHEEEDMHVPAVGGEPESQTSGQARVSATRSRFLPPLDRPGGEAADEVALQRDEDRHRDDHAEDRAGRQQLPALVLLADQPRDGDGDDLLLARAEVQQGDQQVVPDPQELEDGEGGQRRHRHGHDQLPEGLVVAGPVDLGRLDHRFGQRRHVVAEDVDGQRHAEADVGQVDGGVGPGQTEVGVEPEQRHQRHLVGHDQQSDDDDEQGVTAAELDEGEGVGRERRDHDRMMVAGSVTMKLLMNAFTAAVPGPRGGGRTG